MALPHSPEEKKLTEGDPEMSQGMQLNETTPIAMQSKMASKLQANPSCATGISFIEFLLDKSDGGLHCSTSSAIEWCENYLNSSKTLGGVLT